MYDLDTIQAIKHSIEKRKQETIEHLVYGVDNVEQLNYAKGKITATGFNRPAKKRGVKNDK